MEDKEKISKETLGYFRRLWEELSYIFAVETHLPVRIKDEVLFDLWCEESSFILIFTDYHGTTLEEEQIKWLINKFSILEDSVRYKDTIIINIDDKLDEFIKEYNPEGRRYSSFYR